MPIMHNSETMAAVTLTLSKINLSINPIQEVYMSLQVIKEAVANKKMLCPECKEPIQKFEKYAEQSIRCKTASTCKTSIQEAHESL